MSQAVCVDVQYCGIATTMAITMSESEITMAFVVGCHPRSWLAEACKTSSPSFSEGLSS